MYALRTTFTSYFHLCIEIIRQMLDSFRAV